MPHGHCYLWRPDILWLHTLSDVMIALAYFAIPAALIYFIRKRKDFPFPSIFYLFGAFIVLCGLTHVMDVYTTWTPAYRLQGLVKLITGIVSLATAVFLIPLIPKALNLPSPEKLRRMNEESLAREKFTRSILETCYDAFISIDSEGLVREWNHKAEVMFGWSPKEALGRSMAELIMPPQQIPGHLQSITQFLETGEGLLMNKQIEITVRHRDGHEFLAELTIWDLKIGETFYFNSFIRNISERKQAEKALRESEERYRSLFNSIDEGFCIIEMIFDEKEKPVDYRFLQINPSFEKQTGLKDAQGKRMLELAPRHEKHWFEIYGKIALTGQPIRFEDRAEQLRRWYDVFAFRFGEPKNRQVAILFKDITERKQAEEKAREADKNLEAMRIKSEFTATVSHELRTPLAAIQPGIELVCDGSLGPLNAEQKDVLDTVMESVERLDRLINGILDYQKLESKRMQFNFVENDINELILSIRKSFDLAAANKKLTLTCALAEDLPRIRFDRDKIAQVLTNLLSNAIKFSDKGTITVKSSRMKNDIRISVSDEGPGIKKEDFPKLFQSFSQLPTPTERKTGGTGLGLSISQKIIEAHGGQIGVESVYGQGSTFYFILPVSK